MRTEVSSAPIVLGAAPLRLADVVAVARDRRQVTAAPAAVERMRAAHGRLLLVAAGRPVYGAGTGVGANSTEPVADGSDHDRRLLASHATVAGEPYPPDVARAAMVVRANQLAAGRSGASPAVLEALVSALAAGAAPLLHRFGGVGTGDLGALGELGLALTGATPWLTEPRRPLPPLPLAAGDALPLMSSNAVTVAEAALAVADLDELVAASGAVAALTWLAARGNVEALDPAVVAARPHPGDERAAALLRALLAGAAPQPARMQDPFALRALPQVRGGVLAASARAEDVLAIEFASGAENPLLPEADPPVALHHGGWYAGHVALALDGLRLAVHADAALSVRRTALLLDPAATGLRAFLASGPAASSGAMALEYVAGAALARLRLLAAPASLGTAVLSRGVEDHASFAPEAARATADTLAPLRVVVACELVAAVRALRLAGTRPEQLAPAPVGELYAAAQPLPADLGDRSLSADIEVATALLVDLAELTKERAAAAQ